MLTREEGGESEARDVLGRIPGITRGVGFRAPADGLNVVVGMGAHLWNRLYDAPKPAHLHPVAEIRGHKHVAPATPGDLLLHVRANRLDLCFEVVRQIVSQLGSAAVVVDEVHGFKYFDERDLLGFVDGTENPEGPEAVAAVLVGD